MNSRDTGWVMSKPEALDPNQISPELVSSTRPSGDAPSQPYFAERTAEATLNVFPTAQNPTTIRQQPGDQAVRRRPQPPVHIVVPHDAEAAGHHVVPRHLAVPAGCSREAHSELQDPRSRSQLCQQLRRSCASCARCTAGGSLPCECLEAVAGRGTFAHGRQHSRGQVACRADSSNDWRRAPDHRGQHRCHTTGLHFQSIT
jgi:hypothetical protein